jgi:hypothetical protein
MTSKKTQRNPWLLKLNGELIGEYQFLMAALDKAREYFPDHLVFDFEIYFKESTGKLCKVPLA